MSPLDFEGNPVIVGSTVLVLAREVQRINMYYAKVVGLTNNRIKVLCNDQLRTMWLSSESTVMIC